MHNYDTLRQEIEVLIREGNLPKFIDHERKDDPGQSNK